MDLVAWYWLSFYHYARDIFNFMVFNIHDLYTSYSYSSSFCDLIKHVWLPETSIFCQACFFVNYVRLICTKVTMGEHWCILIWILLVYSLFHLLQYGGYNHFNLQYSSTLVLMIWLLLLVCPKVFFPWTLSLKQMKLHGLH